EARFARVAIANTGLPAPSGDEPPMTEAFMAWKAANQRMIDRGDMEVGRMVAGNVGDPALVAAYDAPFPDASYKAGPLIMPQLVPITADYPGAAENRAAWEVFSRWEKPFLTSFSDGDPITRGGERVFQRRIPGAAEQSHSIIEGAGHFLQEQKGEEWADLIVEFIEANP
ncbi:MAG: haloalkane dehalogenase, partial [Pseudomonadales bacterium]|nr:haloalkane dehalogenase [Pseudomonadales bacterium]